MRKKMGKLMEHYNELEALMKMERDINITIVSIKRQKTKYRGIRNENTLEYNEILVDLQWDLELIQLRIKKLKKLINDLEKKHGVKHG